MKKLFTGLLFAIAVTTASAQNGDGAWQVVNTVNKIPGRSECSLVAIKGKLYLIGGDGPAEPAEVYDPQTNTWTEKGTDPCVMHHLQAVALGDKIYVLDAFYEGGFPNQTPNPNAYSYDTKTDTWQKLAEIPVDRRRAGAGEAVYKGKLYLVCGITHGHSSGTNAMFDEYDPKTDTWKVLPDAPHIRDHSMAVVVGDKLYAVGGRNTSYRDPNNVIPFFRMVMLDVDCYDFKTGTWSTLAAKLPMGTGGGTAVNLDDKIYYIGGERATDTKPNGPQKDVYYLDPATSNGWIKTGDLNLARNGVGGTVLGHKIYIAGGSGGGPGGPPPGGNMPGMQGPPPGGNPPNGGPPNGGQGGPPNGPPPGGGGSIALEVFTLK
jgi:N-acetylneuraminic acid mutarotase